MTARGDRSHEIRAASPSSVRADQQRIQELEAEVERLKSTTTFEYMFGSATASAAPIASQVADTSSQAYSSAAEFGTEVMTPRLEAAADTAFVAWCHAQESLKPTTTSVGASVEAILTDAQPKASAAYVGAQEAAMVAYEAASLYVGQAQAQAAPVVEAVDAVATPRYASHRAAELYASGSEAATQNTTALASAVSGALQPHGEGAMAATAGAYSYVSSAFGGLVSIPEVFSEQPAAVEQSEKAASSPGRTFAVPLDLSDAIVERERKHRERIKAKKTNNPRTRRSRPRTPRQCLVDETANTGAGATEAKVNEASQISRDKLHGNGGDELHGNGGDALLADAGQPRQLGQAEKQPTPQEGIEHQPEV